MSFAQAIIIFLVVQRLGELVLAGRNTKRLRGRGAIEVGAAHYPLMVAFHATWLAGIAWFGWNSAVNPILFGIFVVLQALRIWVIGTLGSRWTTRVLILPGETLVSGGPFKYFRHPNYMVVIAEIFVIPAMLGLWVFAMVGGIINLLILWLRIGVEEPALNRNN